MTRQELETLASEKPQELALLFAKTVGKYLDSRNDEGFLYGMLPRTPMYEGGRTTSWYRLPDYLTDWTAVINAGKKAGIEWWKNTINDADEEYIASPHRYYSLSSKRCVQYPAWPDCAALMVVMIEVMEAKL